MMSAATAAAIDATGDKLEGLEVKEKKGASKKEGKKGENKAPGELDPWPAFIADRLSLWEKFKKRHEEELAAKEPQPIKVTLPDGKVMEGESWRTTPYQIAAKISQGLADASVIGKVNGQLWDLDRVLEGDATLELLKFDDTEAKSVFWHSSAHMLGEACERFYGGHLAYGPPIEEGFYYDMFIADRTVSSEEFKKLDGIIKTIVKDKQPFERLELTKAELLEMFKYNEFKCRIINEKITAEKTTVYRNGPLIDLCRGPHIRHTGKVKALQLTKNSSAFWEGKADKEVLQRIYGISFPDAKQLKEWQKFQEEAAKRDHRKLGVEQELFMFHGLSPGSAFFYPRGAHIYNTLMEFMRRQYRKRGYNEVISPNLYNKKLWETSGHWQLYEKNMFRIEKDKKSSGEETEDQYALKPMNCPGHCLMFGAKRRTHKELPLRYADFGVLHRNELAGALSGLTRVRRFQQDDAHIFCRMDQITAEIKGCLEFLRFVYESVFGFTFKLYLSTRPDEDYLGSIETWNSAEQRLTDALNEFGHPWKLNPGDGAFYGPKIDIVICDALRREHQCATIQLDFQLPERFDLNYADEQGANQRPVMVHRAILGSVERMMAILIENFAGKWPFWLSPRQAMIVPVHESFEEYALHVKDTLYSAGFEAEADLDQGDTMNRKIRNAQLAQYNFILVVGEKEAGNGTVNVRTRDNKVRGEWKLEDLVAKFQKLKDEYVKNSEDEF